MTEPLRLELLGGFEFQASSSNLLHLTSRKACALLAYLAMCPGRWRPRERLAALLWNDCSEAQARMSLRQALTLLRRALHSAGVELMTRDDQVGLPEQITTDVAEFEAAIAEGGVRGLERAIALYKGDFLDGLRVMGSAYESWLLPERERLRMQATNAVTRLLNTDDASADMNLRMVAALRILAHDPIQEEVHRGLMRLYMRHGRYAEALRQYRRCSAALCNELNIRPDAETEALHANIKCRQRSRQIENVVPSAIEKRPIAREQPEH